MFSLSRLGFVPKIIQFNYLTFNYTSACKTYRIDFISLSKALRLKAIRYKNRAKLFVLNGNKKPIQYEFHSRVSKTRKYIQSS